MNAARAAHKTTSITRSRTSGRHGRSFKPRDIEKVDSSLTVYISWFLVIITNAWNIIASFFDLLWKTIATNIPKLHNNSPSQQNDASNIRDLLTRLQASEISMRALEISHDAKLRALDTNQAKLEKESKAKYRNFEIDKETWKKENKDMAKSLAETKNQLCSGACAWN